MKQQSILVLMLAALPLLALTACSSVGHNYSRTVGQRPLSPDTDFYYPSNKGSGTQTETK